MNLGPPFERYPGAPRQDDASYRVISPWRDALAWVSIAGSLTLTRYLIRDGSIWRDVLPGSSIPAGGESVWMLDWRDPVELAFRPRIDGDDVTATVTVTRVWCEIYVHGTVDLARLLARMSLPEAAVMRRDHNGLVIAVPARS